MPERTAPEELRVPVPGGSIFALGWGDKSSPVLIFAHATGMCASLYAELLQPLASRFRVIAYDARGHGKTDLPAIPGSIPHDWLLYRNDLRALAAALGGGPVMLAGHSFGATVAFQAAVDAPGLASAVLLVEPAFIPFVYAAPFRTARAAGSPMPNIMADRAERRRADFPSITAMKAAYAGRGVFADWSETALDAYLAGGTIATSDGIRLACDPAWEATSFRGVSTTLEDSMRDCPFPFALLHGTEGSTVAPEDAAAIAAMHPENSVIGFQGTGHFLPVTHPELVRPYLENLARL